MKYLSSLMGILCVFAIHNPKGVYLKSAPPVPEVVAYINDRINLQLAANPEKDARFLKLNGAFNDQRRRLADALIGDPPQPGDDVRAEQALLRFYWFTIQFNEVSRRLEAAIQCVRNVEADPKQPISVRYNALMLLNELRDSSTIAEAQRTLQRYEYFYRNLTSGQARNDGDEIPETPEIPEISQSQYDEQYDEILGIFNQNGTDIDDPHIQHILGFI